MKPTDFAYHLSNYFKSYMPGTLGLREKSILSYQSAILTFIKFMKDEKSVNPDKITFDTFSVELLMEYLQHLETIGNSISTRNHRLTVLRSFFQYVQLMEPAQMFAMQQLLTLKRKKQPKPVMNYLTIEGIKLLLSEPKSDTPHGYRDMLLLSLLYETGARASELISITAGDIRIESPPTIILHGKTGKA
ncbi:MAG: Tyrosine recombinase XerD [Firmicutes bacterium ADurb.Bin356]|nr:MAG: Tyrosine recombinase XerD [Firmicutes bacterium ADurb.Bin356]